ncbi:MAG: ShlB/FhaC/HecB family hemolysin secretion/activation protein [Gammaproteobacteria bacterium]|jgi:hemolysin activation/secretion protein
MSVLASGMVASAYAQEADQQPDTQQTDNPEESATSKETESEEGNGELVTAEDASEAGNTEKTESKPEEVTTFDVTEIRVRGNTLLEKMDVESVIYPFLGKDKTIDDIEAARKALEQRYRIAGFPTVLVDIPEQDVDNGLVVLKVTEARVEQIKITGADYYALSKIREKVPALQEGQTIYIPAVNEQIAMFNATSGDRSVTPILRPGRIPGTMEVELKVKDEAPLHGKVFANDRHSASSTRSRVGASARYDNLWQKEHSLSLQYQTAPEEPDEARIWVATYLASVPESQSTLAFYGVKSDSDIAATETIDVIGRGNILGARFIHSFAGATGMSHNALAGMDYKDFKETTDVDGLPTDTPIEYYNFITQYSTTKTADRYESNFNININFGLHALNDKRLTCAYQATDNNGDPVIKVGELTQFECKRVDAKPNYVYLRSEFDYNWHVGYGIDLYMSAGMQIADSPLISNEQFSIGGASSIRGYYESQVLGDDGVAGTLEIRSPSIGKYLHKNINEFRFFLFADRGAVRNRSKAAGEAGKWFLGSAGVGMNLTAWDAMQFDLAWAYVLEDSDPGTDDAAPAVEKEDSRFHLSLEYKF